MDRAFVDGLASADPTPGGGAASAYAGVLAAALGQMVANLTLGKKRYADVATEVGGALDRLKETAANLERLIELDQEAFKPVSAAFKMPKDTPDEIAARDLMLRSALVKACDVPLDIMQDCVHVLEECDFLARHGNRSVITDVGSAAALAKAAVLSASLNVHANANMMSDPGLSESLTAKADELVCEGTDLGDDIFDYVCNQLEVPLP